MVGLQYFAGLLNLPLWEILTSGLPSEYRDVASIWNFSPTTMLSLPDKVIAVTGASRIGAANLASHTASKLPVAEVAEAGLSLAQRLCRNKFFRRGVGFRKRFSARKTRPYPAK